MKYSHPTVRARCAIQLVGRPAISQAHHLALLAAVRDRDAELAAVTLREHVHSVRDAVLRVLTSNADSI